MSDKPEIPAAFPATRWSLVGAMTGDRAEAALSELCRLYWVPLYAFARREGLGPQDAEDVTQEFFRQVVSASGQLLRDAGPDRGRLRTLLLRVLQRRIVDFRRHAGREKRGAGVLVALDVHEAEALLAESGAKSPEEEFDRQWAGTVLDLAMQRMEADYHANARTKQFEVLRSFLGFEGEEPETAAVQEVLGLNAVAARQAVARFRERFRTTLREVIADTLEDPSEEDIDEELRALRGVLE
jgi:DNA-directed RNA polymerase specialized sigma24 family protein